MPDNTDSLLDVVIVGGGLAGLTAAYRMRDRNILLLEKEEIPGGRTESRTLGPYVYNAGAQVVLGDDGPFARLVDEIGVERTLIAKSKLPLYMNGKLVAAANEYRLLLKMPIPFMDKIKFAWHMWKTRRKYKSLLDADFDPTNPKVIELNSSTVDEFLGNAPESIRELWNVFAITASTMGADTVTPFHSLMVILAFMEDEYFVEGGTHQATIALHRLLGDKALLGAEVTEVKELEDRVKITYDRGGKKKTVHARRCVMASQAPFTLSCVQDLPDWKREALARIEYGSMTTAAFLIDELSENLIGKGVWRVPVSGQRVCAITDPSFTYPDEYKRKTGQGILRVYTGNAVARDLMSRSDGEVSEILLDDLVDMVPEVRGKVVQSDIAHWPHAIPLWKPGHTEIYPLLQRSVGRLHFCGDYTSPGFTNGAIQSGDRVVAEIKAHD